MKFNSLFTIRNRKSLFIVVAGVIAIIISGAIVGRRIVVQNRAQLVGGVCKNIQVDCIVDVPVGADPADYIFEACVSDISNLAPVGCRTVNGATDGVTLGTLNGSNQFTISVPIIRSFSSLEALQLTQFQCKLKVTGKTEACEKAFDGNVVAVGDACAQDQTCPNCACVKDGELSYEKLSTGGIRSIIYTPNADQTYDACYSSCRLKVEQEIIGRPKLISDTRCDVPLKFTEAGTVGDLCASYTFTKTMRDRNGNMLTCDTPPETEDSCTKEICCISNPAEGCELSKNLNNETNQCSEDCVFELDTSSSCLTCDNGLMARIGSAINRTDLGAHVSGLWNSIEFTWGRWGEGYVPINQSESRVAYAKGGVYEIKMKCSNSAEDFEECVKYVPIICASCTPLTGTPSPSATMTPPPTSTTTPPPTATMTPPPSPTPTVPACPLDQPINLEFKIECKNCIITPTPVSN